MRPESDALWRTTRKGAIVDYDSAHRGVTDYFRAHGLPWGEREPGTRPAILIIDMAYGWTDPSYPGGSARMSRAVDRIVELLAAARPLGVPIVYTTSPRPYALWGDATLDADARAALEAAHRGTRIDERIAPLPQDRVIYKTGASAFFCSDTYRHLMSLGVDTLLITGCVTSACVRASVVDAYCYGFANLLVRDCIDDRSEIEHEWHIRDLTRWGQALGLDEAIAYLCDVCSTT